MQTPTSDLTLYVLIGTVLSVLLGSFLLFLLYQFRIRQLRQEQQLHQLKQEFEKTILENRITTQEETFQQIAREIHDNIGMSLTVAKLNLRLMEQPVQEEQRQFYQTVQEQLDKAILDLKDLSRSMNPDIIRHLGLPRAIEQELAAIKRSGLMDVKFGVTGDIHPLTLEREIILYRIVQEALNNSLKHAAGSALNVHLEYGKENLQVRVTDNGKGFDADTLAQQRTTERSTGFFNMEQRCQTLNGQLAVHSEPGKGTAVTITIPLMTPKK